MKPTRMFSPTAPMIAMPIRLRTSSQYVPANSGTTISTASSATTPTIGSRVSKMRSSEP